MSEQKDYDYITVNIFGKEYLLMTHEPLDESTRSFIQTIALRFQDVLEEDLDPAERMVYMQGGNDPDTLYYLFIRHLLALIPDVDFILKPISLRVYPSTVSITQSI